MVATALRIGSRKNQVSPAEGARDFPPWFWQDYDERAIPAMQQAMSGIAGILYDAGLLTWELLENGLPLFVVEAAAAGNWSKFYATDDERLEIFPGHFGSEVRWTVFKQRWPLALAAEIAEWHSKLLDRSVELGLYAPAAAVDRKALSEAYFTAFPTALILDICWAAEQRYISATTNGVTQVVLALVRDSANHCGGRKDSSALANSFPCFRGACSYPRFGPTAPRIDRSGVFIGDW